MEYIWFLIAIVGILLLQYWRSEQSRKKALTLRLQAQWGQVPDREYEEGDLRRIARYYELDREKEPRHLTVDDITWNDLDMDDVFMLLNHTQSSVGEEVLYRMLRTPETDPEVLQERARLTAVLDRDQTLRLELEKILQQIGKNRRQAVCDYISELGKQPHRSNVRHYLGLAAMVAAVGVILWTPDYGVLALAAVVAFQIITYYQQKAKVESYFTCVANVVRLALCGLEISQLADAEEIQMYLKQAEQSAKALEPIRRKAKMIAMGNAMGGSPLDLAADYIKMLLHTDLIAYNQICDRIKDLEPAVWQMIEVIGQLECGLAIASFRTCLGQWCEPELKQINGVDAADSLYLYGEDLYHPLVDRAVPNSVRADRCQLITGSNASGKSTYLKTVALSALLAQTIYTVPGERYQAPFYQIYSSMALKDDLIGGESYYMVEIRSLKRILDRGQDALPVLCFVDEVLRGTNTVERIAASTQILKGMSGQNILCFAATHDGELTYLLEEYYENSHFSETITDGDILFSYRLQPGRAVGRNALQLLGLMGYDKNVLQQARDMAERFDRTGTWSLYDEG